MTLSAIAGATATTRQTIVSSASEPIGIFKDRTVPQSHADAHRNCPAASRAAHVLLQRRRSTPSRRNRGIFPRHRLRVRPVLRPLYLAGEKASWVIAAGQTPPSSTTALTFGKSASSVYFRRAAS